MTDSGSTGYNWRNTLTNYASISGMIAGFCVAFIGIVLGWSVADTVLYEGLTFGHMAVLLFGISAALFIASSELFLHAKNFDAFDLSTEYRDWLQRGLQDKDWNKIWEDSHKQCQANEKYGRICYNLAIFVIFIGLFFAIAPYHFGIALVVSVFGVILELWQLRRKLLELGIRTSKVEKSEVVNNETDRRNLRMFVYGILIGVVGNFLVSYAVEYEKVSGFEERTRYAILLIVAMVVFFHTLQVTGRDLRMPERAIRYFGIFKYLSIVLIGLVWALEFFIIPTLWHWINENILHTVL